MFFKRRSVDAKINELSAVLERYGVATLKFEEGRYVLLHISEKIFFRNFFYRSSFGIQRLLNKLQGAPESVFYHLYLENESEF